MLLRYEIAGTVTIKFKDCEIEIYARFLDDSHIYNEMEYIIESVDCDNETIIEYNNSGELLTLKLNNDEELQLYASEIFENAIDPDMDLKTIFEIEYFKIDESILDFAKRFN